MNFVSYARLAKDIEAWPQKLPDDIGLIIGVPRSGLMVAVMLAQRLNCAVASVNWPEPCLNMSRRPISQSDKVLLVDDSVRSGKSMNIALKEVKKKYSNVSVAAVYCEKNTAKNRKIDYVCRYLNTPRLFQWNVMNHSMLKNSCVDIDGVLCRDPVREEYSNPKKLRDFMVSVKPIVIPRYRIKALVTWRPESSRDVTVEWLKKYGIQYRKLIMRPTTIGEKARCDITAKAAWKAVVYRKLRADMFIESCDSMALHISKKSGKRVLSVRSWRLF